LLPTPITVDIIKTDITKGYWILSAQLQDDKLTTVRKILETGVNNSETRQYLREYVLKTIKFIENYQTEDEHGKYPMRRDETLLDCVMIKQATWALKTHYNVSKCIITLLEGDVLLQNILKHV
jgi:hypothetical protein